MPEEPRPRTPVLAIIIVIVFLAVGGLGVGVAISRLAGPDGRTVEYVIPAGTWQRIQGGERVELVPREIELTVGDTLVIRNDDESGFEVGPFNVGPKTIYRQTFTSARTLKGECVLHPDGQITVTVRDRA